MTVDSYRYLPRSMRTMYESTPASDEPEAWTPLPKPLNKCSVALMTSAGIFLKDSQEGFDEEREWANPEWGDPTYRVIPRTVRQDQIGCSHLHINRTDLLEDVDVVLPLRAFSALESEGRIGALADEHYSFMGYQERKLLDWRNVQGPEVAARLKEQKVDVLLLAPA
ncbi:MAG: glycine/sarcosine/betaine reductase selenoprotein B family protein [Dehalococcoidia bacterium]